MYILDHENITDPNYQTVRLTFFFKLDWKLSFQNFVPNKRSSEKSNLLVRCRKLKEWQLWTTEYKENIAQTEVKLEHRVKMYMH